MDLQKFMQPGSVTKMEYFKQLWIKELRYGMVYGNAMLKILIVEGFQLPITQNVRSHVTVHPELDIYGL